MDQRYSGLLFKAIILLCCLSFHVQEGVSQTCNPPLIYNGYCTSPSQCCSGVCRRLPGDFYLTCRLPTVTPTPTAKEQCEWQQGRHYCTNQATGISGCCFISQENCCQWTGQGACCSNTANGK